MAKINLKLKKIPRSRKIQRWCLDDLESKKRRFQEVLEEEATKHNEVGDGSVENQWVNLRDGIKNEAKKIFGFQKAKRAKKPWITDKMMKKMDERRKWNGNETEEGKKRYKILHNELKRETNKAREEWWEARCDELTEYD
jgi:hypothetical protein